MRLTLSIFLCFFYTLVSAQDIARILIQSAPDNMYMHGWSRENYSVRDTSEVVLTYQMDYLHDVSAQRYRTNRMILQVGSDWGRYYSLAREVGDIKGTRIGRQKHVLGIVSDYTPNQEEQKMLKVAGDDNINGEIWNDYANQKLKDRYHSLQKYNESIEYEESIPSFDWVTQSDTMTICNHLCWRAEATFRGRKWSAWFTPDISVNAGPWKFNGLPGLILKVEDSEKHYSWNCIEIRPIKEPIIYVNTDVVTSTREKWARYYRNVHEQPMTTLRGDATSFRVLVEGKDLDDSWTIPYNPIERE